MKRMLAVAGAALTLGVVTSGANAAVTFLGSEADTLYRATSTSGLTGTFTVSDEIIGMGIVENGVSLAGAPAGSVVAASRTDNGGSFEFYRVDNALAGVPTLVSIGQTDFRTSDIAFANGRMFGITGTMIGGEIIINEIDTTTFATINTFNTGISLVQFGGGGLDYDPVTDRFLVTAPDTDELYSYQLGGASTLLGTNSFDFDRNDIDLLGNTLYGAIEDVRDSTYHFGSFDRTTGEFTSLVNVGPYTSGPIGMIAIPGPATAGLLGLAGIAVLRRRR